MRLTANGDFLMVDGKYLVTVAEATIPPNTEIPVYIYRRRRRKKLRR